ncbi:COMM domain-containing protein 5-like isoform X2 [Amphibalanus amphitrite]|nr:COMM domain-containing protein 5-like isoform X2 [Amphibalanus amphitrite]
MTDFLFGSSKLPLEIKLLHSAERSISETDLKTLLEAASLHLAGHQEEARCRYEAVPGRLAAVYGGLISLLRAGRALPPARRRADILTDALRRYRVPDSWHSALVAAMCASPEPPPTAGPVQWTLDVIISDSERGQVLEPSVGLTIPNAAGGGTSLQLPKAQFLRLRREMAVARREVDNVQAKFASRVS